MDICPECEAKNKKKEDCKTKHTKIVNNDD